MVYMSTSEVKTAYMPEASGWFIPTFGALLERWSPCVQHESEL